MYTSMYVVLLCTVCLQILFPGADRRILVWDIGSAAQVCELKGHSDSVYQLAFSRDGSILASGGLDNTVKLWNTSGFEEIGRITDPQKWYDPTQMVLSTVIKGLFVHWIPV